LKNKEDVSRLVKLVTFIVLTIQTNSNDEAVNYMALTLQKSSDQQPGAAAAAGGVTGEVSKEEEWIIRTSRLLSSVLTQLPLISKVGHILLFIYFALQKKKKKSLTCTFFFF
jgi:hypothetical protein